MSGWIVILLLAAAVLLGMLPWLRKDVGALQFVGAALLLAFAGYAWQGQPGMTGVPKAQEVAPPRPDSDFARLRREVFPQFDRNAGWLTTAEAIMRMGRPADAVGTLRNALNESPRSMVLWLGLADALLQHANGMLTPSAHLAFERAASVGSGHPAPSFFYALALAKNGQFDEAEQLFGQVLSMPSTTEAWRQNVDRARAAITRMRAGGPAGPPAAQ